MKATHPTRSLQYPEVMTWPRHVKTRKKQVKVPQRHTLLQGRPRKSRRVDTSILRARVETKDRPITPILVTPKRNCHFLVPPRMPSSLTGRLPVLSSERLNRPCVWSRHWALRRDLQLQVPYKPIASQARPGVTSQAPLRRKEDNKRDQEEKVRHTVDTYCAANIFGFSAFKPPSNSNSIP